MCGNRDEWICPEKEKRSEEKLGHAKERIGGEPKGGEKQRKG